jgi:hypothetical protein
MIGVDGVNQVHRIRADELAGLVSGRGLTGWSGGRA